MIHFRTVHVPAEGRIFCHAALIETVIPGRRHYSVGTLSPNCSFFVLNATGKGDFLGSVMRKDAIRVVTFFFSHNVSYLLKLSKSGHIM